MNKRNHRILNDQTGSALIIVLLVLVSLTALGLMALRSSSIDMDIAASNKCTKETWYATDGGNQMTTELIERNIEDRGKGDWETGQYGPTGQVSVFTADFWKNEEDALCANNVPTKSNRDIKVPSNNDPAFGSEEFGSTEVYIRIYGATGYSPGAALDQSSGYDGRAKSAAGGGAQIVYNIRGFGDGAGPCEARILQVWRHLI
jgi:hypothetical protein